MTLDLAVSRAVAQSQLLEAALHSSARWFIETGGTRVEAKREVHEHGVVFTACFVTVPAEVNGALLLEDDTIRSARPFEHPGDGEFCLEWNLSLEETVRA